MTENRNPPPPEQLVGALQNRVHTESGAFHSVQVAKAKSLSSIERTNACLDWMAAVENPKLLGGDK